MIDVSRNFLKKYITAKANELPENLCNPRSKAEA